jgi:hypothetical protein
MTELFSYVNRRNEKDEVWQKDGILVLLVFLKSYQANHILVLSYPVWDQLNPDLNEFFFLHVRQVAKDKQYVCNDDDRAVNSQDKPME